VSKQQIKHLVKMANQIAQNLASAGDDEEVAKQASEHINKFWTPLMKQQITSHLNDDGEGLTPVASKVIVKLSSNNVG
jgi:formate dehydrogenase subunit delta